METTHLLSLKVMRVSKPALATSSQPFFSTSPPLSAHASASLMSLQGARPLPDHPKTLRDFSLTEVLTLPSTFGAISLGETFSSAFCVNNECDIPVSGVVLKMEIQTVTAKIPLAEYGGLEKTLNPNEPVEGVVSHEIKELNQHVLACTVSYLVPDSLAHSPSVGPPENPDRPNLRTFRKYYKFTVTNPLSVKTKVHLPKSPAATMSRTEREKVFLEVHVQNLTSEPLCFERMKLDPVEGWDAEDVNTWMAPTSTNEGSPENPLAPSSVFSGTMAIMQPQDTRQYLFILTPKPDALPSFPIIYQPGSNIALGRLDISWRTGRLLTSVLSRRIPLLPVPPPVPAIPPHLQQVARPQSPGPPRPGSPAFRVRNQPTARPQSPGPVAPPAPNPQHIERPDVEVDLVVRNTQTQAVIAEEPFAVDITLTLSALLPSTSWPRPGAITPAQAHIGRDRILHLVVQHVVPPRRTAISQSLANAQNARIAPEPTPPSHVPPYALRRSMSTASLAKRSESTVWGDAVSISSDSVMGGGTTLVQSPIAVAHDDRHKFALPSPFKDVSAAVAGSKLGQAPGESDSLASSSSNEQSVVFLGTSSLRLAPFRLSSVPQKSPPSESAATSDQKPIPPQKDQELPRGQASVDFSLQYVAMREGFSTIGGVKVFLVEDREVPNGEEAADIRPEDRMEPKLIREWEFIGELWAKSTSMKQ